MRIKSCLSMHSFSVTSANIAVTDIKLKTRFFGLHFLRRKYRCIFNHFYTMAPKATEFGEITQNKGHYAVQGHSRSPIFGTNRKPIYDFRLVINTNLYPISHRFQVIADYWSNLRCRQGARGIPVFNTLVRDESLNSGPRNLALGKLEESLYRTVLIY